MGSPGYRFDSHLPRGPPNTRIDTTPHMTKHSGTSAPRALFLGLGYVGHQTRFMNLQSDIQDDARLNSSFASVQGWTDGGFIERLPLVPKAVRGRMRATVEAAALARFPRPDVIWTAVSEVLVPHLWSMVGPLKRPLVLDLDWTARQGEKWAPIYFDRQPKSGARWRIARAMEHALWSRVSLFVPWSEWAAEGLRAEGISEERIMVLPPGLNLDQFQPNANKSAQDPARPLQLLFVGGDFDRKGGPMLVEQICGRLAGTCEIDIVTRDPVEPSPGVRVHRAEANSPKLRELFATADLFVMPTRAEAFGIVTIEALASGLPVLVGDVGGARSIVDDGEVGWLIPPTPEALADALDDAIAQRDQLPAMGIRAREVAERRFDGKKNHAHLVSAMVELVETGTVSAETRAAKHLR